MAGRVLMAARWVVGHENGNHVLHEDGEVVFEGDRIVFVGHDFPGEVERRVECGHALVGPGFVDFDALSDLDTTVLAFDNQPAWRKGRSGPQTTCTPRARCTRRRSSPGRGSRICGRPTCRSPGSRIMPHLFISTRR